MNILDKHNPLLIDYIKSTILFIFLVIFISIPFYSISQQNLNWLSLYAFASYFITIIGISISYHHYFHDEWKLEITSKMLLFYFFLHQVAVSGFFFVFNGLFDISTSNIPLIFVFSFIACIFLLWIDADMIQKPLYLSSWIFRSFDGKALTFTKKIDDSEHFKILVNFLRRTSFLMQIDNSVLIYDGSFSKKPTYFLKHNKENGIVELQITKQKWFSFFVDESIEVLKDIFISFGFDFLGDKDIRNSLFISNRDYPKFAKAKQFSLIWMIFGTITLVNNIILITDVSLINYVTYVSNQIYNPFNSFVAENPGLSLIIAAIVGGTISHIYKIKSFFEILIQNFKNM